MEALFLAPTLPKIGGAFTLKDNLVMKRFSVKELRQWIMETATEAIQGDSFKTGTVFYKTLPGGVSAVISWSEYGDYWECDGPHEKDNMIDQAVDQAPIENLTIDDVCELLEDELVMLPVSIYDHSGVSIWLGSPNCMWDSGYVGFMYLTKEDALKELGNCTEENWKERAIECMEAEMKVYNCYISGDVYGFVIEDEEENEIDSCWGFYGDESVKDQNIENRQLIDKEIAHREKINLIINSFSWS